MRWELIARLMANISVRDVSVSSIHLKPGVILDKNERNVTLKSSLTNSLLWLDIIAITVKEVRKQSLMKMDVIVINVDKDFVFYLKNYL